MSGQRTTPADVELHTAREKLARMTLDLRAAEQRIAQLEARVRELEADLRLMPTADVLVGRVGQVTDVLRAIVTDLQAVQRTQRGEAG